MITNPAFVRHSLDVGVPAVSYTSAGATFAFWSQHISDAAAVVTALVAVFGLLLNIWYKLREDRRAEARLQMQVRSEKHKQ